jgi:hypothetical protein
MEEWTMEDFWKYYFFLLNIVSEMKFKDKK